MTGPAPRRTPPHRAGRGSGTLPRDRSSYTRGHDRAHLHRAGPSGRSATRRDVPARPSCEEVSL